jgi:hypothetical protein
MVVRSILGGLILAASMLAGCSNETAAANGGLDGQGTNATDKNATTDMSTTGGTTTATGPAACTAAASWKANNDLAFDDSSGSQTFATAINGLISKSKVSPMAVSNLIAPHCVWMVAFSAADYVGASAKSQHAATFTEMFHHTTGLWTVAPQTEGWIRVVDVAGSNVWIPLSGLTGSATYGSGECTSLSEAKASAVSPHSAASLKIKTDKGQTTLGDLLGKEDSKNAGWAVHFTFTADLME